MDLLAPKKTGSDLKGHTDVLYNVTPHSSKPVPRGGGTPDADGQVSWLLGLAYLPRLPGPNIPVASMRGSSPYTVAGPQRIRTAFPRRPLLAPHRPIFPVFYLI